MSKIQQEKEAPRKDKVPEKDHLKKLEESIEELRFDDTKSRLGVEIRLNRNVVVGFSLVAAILWVFFRFPFVVVILVSSVV